MSVFLYGSECWTLRAEQETRMETADMRFLWAVARYRMTDHKCNEVLGKDLEIADINTVRKLFKEVARTFGKNA
jgi:hypothetical protein